MSHSGRFLSRSLQVIAVCVRLFTLRGYYGLSIYMFYLGYFWTVLRVWVIPSN